MFYTCVSIKKHILFNIILIQHRQMGLEDLNVSFNSSAALTVINRQKSNKEGRAGTRQSNSSSSHSSHPHSKMFSHVYHFSKQV